MAKTIVVLLLSIKYINKNKRQFYLLIINNIIIKYIVNKLILVIF